MRTRTGRGTARLLLLSLLPALLVLDTASAAPSLPADLLKAFLQEAHVTKTPAPVLLLLCAARGAVATARPLVAAGFSTQVVLEPEEWISAVGGMGNAAHTVVLDTACPEARALLASVDELDMFRGPRRWVLLVSDGEHPADEETPCNYLLETGAPESDRIQDCHCRTASLLAGLRVFYDSDVCALCIDTTTGSAVSVLAHRVGKKAGLRLQRDAGWRALDDGSDGVGLVAVPDRRPVPARRLDFHHEVCNIGFLVMDQKNFHKSIAEGTGLTDDYFATFGWELAHELAAMLNMTVNATLTPDWGHTPAHIKPYKGLLWMHYTSQIELGGVGFSHILEPHRLKCMHFTNFYCPSSGVMVLRAPPVSYENNVYTIPFPKTLWSASSIMVVLCVAVLVPVMYVERVLRPESVVGIDDTFHSSSDVILFAVAAVCQQGSNVEPRGIPGRIISLLLFLLILVLFTCYSASIMVFMQRTSTSIKSTKDLPDSQVKLGAIAHPVVWHYLEREQEPIRKRLYNEKFVVNGKREIYKLADGLRKVRDEYFGFFGVRNHIFAEVGSKWQEHEKCQLVSLADDLLLVRDPHFTITRGSYRTDAFRIMLRRLAERGLWHRMLRRFVRQVPKCSNADAVFNPVSLVDCRGAFYMYVATTAASLVVFLLELISHQRKVRVHGSAARRATEDAAWRRAVAAFEP